MIMVIGICVTSAGICYYYGNKLSETISTLQKFYSTPISNKNVFSKNLNDIF